MCYQLLTLTSRPLFTISGVNIVEHWARWVDHGCLPVTVWLKHTS